MLVSIGGAGEWARRDGLGGAALDAERVVSLGGQDDRHTVVDSFRELVGLGGTALFRRASGGSRGQGTRVVLSQRVALSVPLPPAHRSEPDCPAIASLPLCPDSRSRPVPPFRTSFPASPNSLSLPLLPDKLSRPGPPQMTSLPPSPAIVSFPARPWMTSLPGVPKIVLLLLSPTMVAGSPLHRTGGWTGGWPAGWTAGWTGGRTVMM